jgi:hypothetical protein
VQFPDFVPSISPSEGREISSKPTAKGVWYVSIFGIRVKSVDAPSFPIPVGKGGDFFLLLLRAPQWLSGPHPVMSRILRPVWPYATQRSRPASSPASPS